MRSDQTPAFPRSGYYPDTRDLDWEDVRARLPTATEPTEGMSLRDYAAIKIAAALISAGAMTLPHSEGHEQGPQRLASLAVRTADALLRELHPEPRSASDD